MLCNDCCLADYIFFPFKDEKRFIFLGNMNAKDAKEKKMLGASWSLLFNCWEGDDK